MNYVELLHVARRVRNLGIFFAALVLIALISRPFSHSNGESYDIPKGVAVQTEHGADGTTVQRFTSHKGNHVTVETDRQGVQTITVVSPEKGHGKATHVQFAHAMVRVQESANTNTTVITHDPRFSIGTLFLIAAFVGAIAAAAFGLVLSRENDGHLELAWTKPVSRVRYALGAIALDVAGALATAVLAFGAIVLTLAIYGEAAYMQVYPGSWLDAVFSIAFMLSFYGIIIAITASLRSNKAAVFAVIFPVMCLLPVFRQIPGVLGTAIRVIDTVIPNAYFYNYAGGGNFTWFTQTAQLDILVPLVMFVVGIAASLLQWQRLEA